MSVFESIERYPVEYLPTGDKALLIAWMVLTDPADTSHAVASAVLCLEDGRAQIAEVAEIKFDYRYDNHNQAWVDVSKIFDGPEGDDANADPQTGDDGGASVQGQVPDLDRAGPGDPGGQP